MSKFYQHKESRLIVRPVGAGEDYVDVVLACEMEARLAMTSAEFDEKFEELDAYVLLSLDTDKDECESVEIYYKESVPPGFENDATVQGRRLRLTVHYTDIVASFLHRVINADTGTLINRSEKAKE